MKDELIINEKKSVNMFFSFLHLGLEEESHWRTDLCFVCHVHRPINRFLLRV